MQCKTLLAGMAIILLLVAFVAGEVPQLIAYQGRLTDGGGNPVADGLYSIHFQIYDAPSGGTVKWNNGVRQVNVTGGLFTYNLGDSTALPDNLFANDTGLWLGIKVGADPELAPRTKFTSYGFAYQALRADTAEFALNTIGGSYLPLAGGTMTGPITSIGDPSITMGKGNFGTNNTNSGVNAIVAGENNDASGDYSSIGGGTNDTASGAAATIGGGFSNVASADGATVGGGGGNRAEGFSSTVSGGNNNIAALNFSTVAGGNSNKANEWGSTVTGGQSNSADARWSTVGGGRFNVAGDTGSTVAGGAYNKARGRYNTISGGADRMHLIPI